MPRYFFNTRIGGDRIQDTEGQELRDPDQAWEAARTLIRQLLRQEGGRTGLLAAVLDVTDEDGEIVLEFPFSEAVMSPNGSQTRH